MDVSAKPCIILLEIYLKFASVLFLQVLQIETVGVRLVNHSKPALRRL